jgi:dinuclear metal center YbgI/SA1388 family protein
LSRKTKSTGTGPLLSDIVQTADRLFPFELAERWDNCGVQVGDPGARIQSVAFSLDAGSDAVEYAFENSCQLLITHHPLIFAPLKSITPLNSTGKVLLSAVEKKLSVLSLHTNLDAAPNGLNDYLSALIGLTEITVPENAPSSRMGILPQAEPIDELASHLAKKLDLDHISLVTRDNRIVRKAFVVSGSGMSYLPVAVTTDADVMITGDVRYHSALEALEMNLPVIDAGHYGLEKICVPLMLNAFKQAFIERHWNVKCNPFYQSNPFRILKP